MEYVTKKKYMPEVAEHIGDIHRRLKQHRFSKRTISKAIFAVYPMLQQSDIDHFVSIYKHDEDISDRPG